MVRSQNDRSFERHSFRIINIPAKVKFVNQPKNAPAKKVDDVHGFGAREVLPLPFVRGEGWGEGSICSPLVILVRRVLCLFLILLILILIVILIEPSPPASFSLSPSLPRRSQT